MKLKNWLIDPLTKNPDKGISLEQEVDPGWKDNQHEPELAVLKLGTKNKLSGKKSTK